MRYMGCIISMVFVLALSCNNPAPKKIEKLNIDSAVNKMQLDVQPFVRQFNYSLAFHYLDSVYPTIQNTGNDGLISAWNRLKGSVFMYNGLFDSANLYLINAQRVAEKISSSNKYLINAKATLMNSYAREGKYDSALKYGQEAHKMAQNTDSAQIAKVSETLSEVFVRVGDTANVRKYLFEAYRYATDPETQFALYANIAKYYFDLREMDSAKVFHQKMKDANIYRSNYTYHITTLENIGVMLIESGELEEGLANLKEAVNVGRKYDVVHDFTYRNIAEVYFRMKKFSLARIYADSALSFARSNDDYLSISSTYGLLADIERAENKTDEAYRYLDSSYRSYSKNDSISFVEKSQELETKYAVKNKDEEIASLAFQNQINQKIRNQQRLIIVTMIIGIFLLLSVGLLAWRRRQTQTKLNESELKQLVLRNQIDPHFISNTLSVLQGFIRTVNTDKATAYNLQLSRLLRLSFENAGKNFILFKDEVDFLNNYLSLQLIEWGNKFEYAIESYPDYENDDIYIPPMILQPFIENTVMHGFANLNYKGIILIKISRLEHSLLFLLEDNGTGLRAPATNATTGTHSTDITKQRLALLSRKTGRPTKLDIIDKALSGDAPGVRVSIELPFLRTPS